MGWLQQGFMQSQFRRSSEEVVPGGDFTMARGQRKAARRQPLILQMAAIAAAVLLGPLEAAAFDPGTAAYASRSQSGLHTMSEEELRRVFARGLPEDRLFRAARSFTSGFDVATIGDMATLLNPVSSLLDADITFRDAVFNPLNPTVLIDKSGSYLMRVPDSIGVLNFENIHVKGSDTTSFGSVTIRGIDLRGTTVRVTLRH